MADMTSDRRAALVEKVARAICKADGTEPDSLDPWMGEHQHPAWEDYEEQATAAIDLIRAEVLEDAAAEIERLRALYDEAMTCWHQTTAQCQIAADQTTTLRATNERLRGALERHVCDCKSNCAWERDETCPSWDARAALTQETPNDR